MAYYSNYGQNTKTNTHRAVRNDINTAENGFNPSQDATKSSNSLLQTSTNVFVLAQGSIVGMIQSFSVTENRTINKLQAIGYEGVVQAVPSNTQGGQLNITRIALYQSSLWNALGLTSDGVAYNPVGKKVHEAAGYDITNIDKNSSTAGGNPISSKTIFKTLKDQRVPLEIQVRTKKSGSADEYYYETYIDCWLASYSKSYSVGTITVSEQATVQYADVY